METTEIKAGDRVHAIDPQGKLSPGEYTGFSVKLGKYMVSFYNGYTKGFAKLSDINKAS